MSLFGDARMAGRYLAGLRALWRAPENWHDAVGVIRGWLAQREDAFARMVQQSIYGNPRSPYLPLLQAAGLSQEQVLGLVRDVGLEGCLRRLYEAGVYVTLDEFKGRKPIQRHGLELAVTAGDFNTVTSGQHLPAHSGGSRTRGTATPIDVGDLMYELPPRYLFSQAYGLLDKPFALWRPPPPATAGLRAALRNVKLGMSQTHWFSLTRPGLGPASGKSALITLCTALGSTLMGHPITYPRYMPVGRADAVARWLAGEKARGVLVHLDVSTSMAVRICLEARALGLDISGQTVRVGGEPLTPAKAAVFQQASLRYCSQYAITETATLGLSCATSPLLDDMHLLTYRMAVIQQPKELLGWPEPVGALLVSVFSPRITKVLLNVEVGDYGVLDERPCDCPLGAAGLHTHRTPSAPTRN